VLSYTLARVLVPVWRRLPKGLAATMPWLSFTGQPTVVVSIATAPGGWSEVLTPSRNVEPSQRRMLLCQTAGWVRSGDRASSRVAPAHPASASLRTRWIVDTAATGKSNRRFPCRGPARSN
jgi:hypothetical protein